MSLYGGSPAVFGETRRGSVENGGAFEFEERDTCRFACGGGQR